MADSRYGRRPDQPLDRKALFWRMGTSQDQPHSSHWLATGTVDQEAMYGKGVEFVILPPIKMLGRVLKLVFDAIDLIANFLRLPHQIWGIGSDNLEIAIEALQK